MIRNCLLTAVFAILILSSPLTALAQDSLNVRLLNEYHHNWEWRLLDVCVDGDYAYMTFGNDGVRILNISDPAQIVEISHYCLPEAYAIAKSGNFIYVGSWQSDSSEINIFDVSDPYQPTVVQAVSIGRNPSAIRIFGDYAFVCTFYSSAGLAIIDISDPPNAHIVSQPPDMGMANDIEVRNDTAFIAAGPEGLRLFNISDISDPQYLLSFTNGSWVLGMAVSGNYAYIGCDSNGMCVLDISTMQVVGSNDSIVAHGRIKKSGDYLYVDNGIEVSGAITAVNIANPIDPVISSIYYPPFSIWNFAILDNRAYIVDEQSGLIVLDISNPANIHEVFSYDRHAVDMGVIVLGDYAYIENSSRLAVVNIADIQDPREISSVSLDIPNLNFEMNDEVIYMLSEDRGFCAIDVSNPESPFLRDSYDLSYAHWNSLAIYDQYAYVGDRYGIQIMEISNPDSITEAGHFFVHGDSMNAVFVIAIYDHFMVIKFSPMIIVTDISDPIHPVITQSFIQNEYWLDSKIIGNYAYVVSYDYFSIYDNTSWVLISRYRFDDPTWDYSREIEISGNYAYIASEYSGLSIFDISNPAELRLAGNYKNLSGGLGVALSGNTIVIAAFFNLEFYEFTPEDGIDEPSLPAIPTEFALLPNYPNPFNGTTRIQYELPISSDVKIDIYDISGRLLETLLSEFQSAGEHSIDWNAESASSGIFFYKIQAGNYSKTNRMLLIK